MIAKYGEKAHEEVRKAVKKTKAGKQKSGKKGVTVPAQKRCSKKGSSKKS